MNTKGHFDAKGAHRLMWYRGIARLTLSPLLDCKQTNRAIEHSKIQVHHPDVIIVIQLEPSKQLAQLVSVSASKVWSSNPARSKSFSIG